MSNAMSKSIEKRSDYDQAIGSMQQHDIDLSKFLVTGETITSATATHTPRNSDGDEDGTPGTPIVGSISGGIIPIMVDIPSDNSIGLHILTVKPVLANPTELPTFRILINVPF